MIYSYIPTYPHWPSFQWGWTGFRSLSLIQTRIVQGESLFSSTSTCLNLCESLGVSGEIQLGAPPIDVNIQLGMTQNDRLPCANLSHHPTKEGNFSSPTLTKKTSKSPFKGTLTNHWLLPRWHLPAQTCPSDSKRRACNLASCSLLRRLPWRKLWGLHHGSRGENSSRSDELGKILGGIFLRCTSRSFLVETH